MLAASLLLALSPLALAGSPAFELSGTPSTWHSKYTMDTYHAQFLFDTLGQLSYRESMKFAGNVQFVYPNSSAYWITASDSNAVVFSKSIKSYLKDGGVEAILFSPPHEDGSGRSPFANQTLRESEDNESNFATERWIPHPSTGEDYQLWLLKNDDACKHATHHNLTSCILGVSEMFEMMDTHEPYYSLKSKSGATSVTAASSAVFAALAVALMLVVA